MSAARPRISHVIYDMDGLLLDTESCYTEVTQEIVGRYGKVFDWSVKSNMIGRPAIDSARYLVQTLDLPFSAEDYLRERESMLEERFAHTRAQPGAEQLTRHLHAHGVPQAVASSSTTHFFDIKTRQHRNWFSLFDCVVLGDDPNVLKGKPAPDIFLAAAQRMGAEPASCLAFEDAPSGLKAALGAGMSVVVVPDPHMDRSVYAGSSEILDSLESFRPETWGLPPFES